MNQITEHIWIGSYMSLSAVNTMKQNNITHVLSVLDVSSMGFKPEEFKTSVKENFVHLYLDVDDTEDQDIAQFFHTTNEFIDGAISKGEGVLVHCIAGISRSVTCACAYLMKQNSWTVEEVLKFVRDKRPVANPNPSFVEQLQVYYKCGYSITPDCKPYREWKLQQQVTQGYRENLIYNHVEIPPTILNWKHILSMLVPLDQAAKVTGVKINDSPFALTQPICDTLQDAKTDRLELDCGNDKILISSEHLVKALAKVATQSIVWRCKQCSTRVASSHSLLFHEQLPGSQCQLWFFEPIEWMRDELEKGNLEGRLLCPKCGYKLGSYHWQGSRCTCGKWITPAITLKKSRVDEMVIKRNFGGL